MNAVMDAEVRSETEELDHRSLDTAAQHSDIGSVSSTAGTCDDSDGHVDLDFHPNLQRDPEEEGGKADEAEARNSSVSLESQALEEFKDEGPSSDVIRRIMTCNSSSPAAYSSVSSRTPPRALDRPNRHIFMSQAARGYDSGRECWGNDDDDGNNGLGHYGPGALLPMDGAAEGVVGGGFAIGGQDGGLDSAKTTLLCDIRSEPDGLDENERDVDGGSGDACTPAIELGPLLASSGVVGSRSSPFRRRHNNSPLGTYSWQRDFGGETDVEGVTGLQNLGNTCFMNSALQCLSNTPPLRDYFLSGEYKKDINEDNKLGTGGELAREFGALIGQIWRGRHGWVAPRAFKRALGHHAEQFMGFDQQDAQELIAYLLDGIHEDLNKVSVKPYAESKVEAAAEEDDTETAERAWEQHRSRNDSKIVDIFQGQYKSVITCPDPDCSRISTIFDPFMYLSLPIPTVNETLVPLTYFSADGSPPVRWGTNVPSDAKMGVVRTALAQHLGVPVTDIVLAERWNNGFYQIYENDKDASSTLNEDVVAYHVPTPWVATFEMELTKDEGWEEKLSAFVRNDRLHAIKRRDLNLYKRLMHALECFDDGRVHDVLSEPLTEESYHELVRLLKLYDIARQLDQLHRRGLNPFILKVFCCRPTHGPYKHYVRPNSELGDPLIVGFEPGETKVGQVRRDILRRLRYRLRPSVGPSDSCRGRGGVVEEEETKGEDLENMRESKVDEEDEENSGDNDVLCNGDAMGAAVGPGDEGEAVEGWMEEVAASWEFLFVNRQTKEYQYIRAGKGRVKEAGVGNALFNDDDDDDDDGTDDAGAGLEESELDVTVMSDWEPGDNEILVEWPDDVRARHFDCRPERAFVTVDPGYAEVERKVKEGVSIYSCIELFQHKEQLGKTEAWRCPDCADFKEAWKELRLWKVPPILVLHLKRFQYEGWLRRKIDTIVTFPVKGLDLRPYVLNQSEDDPPIYDLYAVSNHSGGLTGGHYTAYALNDVTAEWYSLDDSWTKQIGEDSVVSKEAYVLFYRRVSTYLSSPLPRPALEPVLKPHAEREDDEAQAKKSGAVVDRVDEEDRRDRLAINGRSTTNSPEPDHDDDGGGMRTAGLDGPDGDDDDLFLDPTDHLNPQPKPATVDIRPEEKVLVKDDDCSSISAPCNNSRKRASPLQIEDSGRRSRRMLDGEFKAVDYEDASKSSFEPRRL